MKDLTNTAFTRQNILNNPFAVHHSGVPCHSRVGGNPFRTCHSRVGGNLHRLFEVSERTIDNCLMKNKEELTKNGYEVLKGNRLIDFMLVSCRDFDNETDFVIKTNSYEALSGNRLIYFKLVSFRGFGNETDFVTKTNDYGYEVFSGNHLIDLKLVSSRDFDREIDFPIKSVRLDIFNFQAFLNVGMFLSDSKGCLPKSKCGGRRQHYEYYRNKLLTFEPTLSN